MCLLGDPDGLYRRSFVVSVPCPKLVNRNSDLKNFQGYVCCVGKASHSCRLQSRVVRPTSPETRNED